MNFQDKFRFGPLEPAIAHSGDPMVPVDLLVENVFCPRACVLRHELDEEERESPSFIGRGRRDMFYQFSDLVNAIKQKAIFILITILLMVAVNLIGRSAFIAQIQPQTRAFLLQFSSVLLDLLGVTLLVPFIAYLLLCLWIYFWAKKASTLPDKNSEKSQKVNVWSLINAKFSLRKPNRGQQYESRELGLTGNPWRILVRGKERIPVFNRFKATSDEETGKLDNVRMAAYSYLIAKSEGSDVSYGIVLFGKLSNGKTVPYKKNLLNIYLPGVRRTLNSPEDPGGPLNPNETCRTCKYNKWSRQRGGNTCGVRFNWEPPRRRRY